MDADEKRFEEERLRIQRSQVRASWASPLVAGILLVAVAWFTIGSDVRAQTKATETDAQVRTATAVAESGERFCSLWGTSTVPDVSDLDVEGACKRSAEQPPTLSVQRELIAELLEHPSQQQQILAMWRAVYVVHDWIDRIGAALARKT